MREIKFRAWNQKDELMSDPFDIFRGTCIWRSKKYTAITYASVFPDYHIMQFTGLKDKNGKEIYEGDIVQRGVIVFHNGKFQGQYFSEGVMYELWEDDLCQEKGIEVIGNIHQHPELIS